MLDGFFVRALLAGIGVAIVAGPLGCFIVWRRLAYFGDTLSHAALLGVALALLLEVNVTLASSFQRQSPWRWSPCSAARRCRATPCSACWRIPRSPSASSALPS